MGMALANVQEDRRHAAVGKRRPRGRAGYLDKQIQAARKEREQLKRERLVATKIIELAQRGVRDASTLSATTLKEFKHY
jgi:hypothetical protein